MQQTEVDILLLVKQLRQILIDVRSVSNVAADVVQQLGKLEQRVEETLVLVDEDFASTLELHIE